MFTGLIQGVGTVDERRPSRTRSTLTISWEGAGGLRLGDSIAVNGVCLTAARLGPDWFSADIMAETWQRTNLSLLRRKDSVNLEPALKMGDPLGGHYVSGHVDGMGRIVRIARRSHGVAIHLAVSQDIRSGITDRGSVAVNGVSLTVQGLEEEGFYVSLIPHTHRETNLNRLRIGDWVNVEVDSLNKTMLQQAPAAKGVTRETLRRYGFMG